MDKSWIGKPRINKDYVDGVAKFLKFADEKSSVDGKIICPCRKCSNRYWFPLGTVEEHLTWNGFLLGYTQWDLHGECTLEDLHNASSSKESSHVDSSGTESDDIQSLLKDAFGVDAATFLNEPFANHDNIQNYDELHRSSPSNPLPSEIHTPPLDNSSARFERLMQENGLDLYPGCSKYTKLSFLLRLFHLKCSNGWSGNSFTMLLELLQDAFPKGSNLPSSSYEAKKLIRELGLGYEKIQACTNNCMLYWGENEKDESCHVCKASRWKESKEEDVLTEKQEAKKKKACKVLRYFPIIPRLKRMFMSGKTASDATWHHEGRTKDGVLRHPADGLAWKAFDERFPDFASDPRNLRLGLASDGFNPFGTMSTAYSTWPVVVIIYNLPPWLCMKKSSLILSMIIPGEKGPGDDLDVFLQPLNKELDILWQGIEAFDANKKEPFTLKAALVGTINDFPALANLSGRSTKGRVACPTCGDMTCSRWLKNGKKFCYMGHRRWLHKDHPYRFEKDKFDGTIEQQVAPIALSGSDIRELLEGMDNTKTKSVYISKKRAREDSSVNMDKDMFEDADPTVPPAWKRRMSFFNLPYWEFNLLRHNLDIMHIEKNVCDNIIGTLLNLEGKTKDNLKARQDLQDLDIRHQLHPVSLPNNKLYLPPARYTMSLQEKDDFLTVLKDIKVPDGYASNISRCVHLKERKITNMKSHDCHILMQDILPIALRASMPKDIVDILTRLSSFFKSLYSKTIDPNCLDQLQKDIVLILCDMEKIFPPGFFTIMVHLLVHLTDEVKLGGPVHYRNMYPVERYLMRLKGLVHNKAHPEGSIAEGYLAEETLLFCSRYMKGVEPLFHQTRRNDDCDVDGLYLFSSGGRGLGKAENVMLEEKSLQQAHRYVLLHSDIISVYRSRFLEEQRRANRHMQITASVEQKWIIEKFSGWLQDLVPTLLDNNSPANLVALAQGPNDVIKRYKGYIINGYRFHCKHVERLRKTQNSGVVVMADGKSFYGVLTDIIELNYYGTFKVVLLRCDWADISRGLKKDTYGCNLVNFSKLAHTGQNLKDDPFIFSSQAKQAFYVQHPKTKQWSFVFTMKPRDLYDAGSAPQDEDEDDSYTQCEPENIVIDRHPNDCSTWTRTDIEGLNV